MYPVILDTKTGEMHLHNEVDGHVFWWGEGNGSCDCNRAIFMGKEEEVQKELGLEDNICFGSNRFLIVDVRGDLGGRPAEEVLRYVNESYPQSLIDKHCTPFIQSLAKDIK